ncbi:hypothetical protein L6452_15653 [Arctium lappa]|uniref:Uncharacterized protein n=1 Tax=Arctium lappa TaxID=4217 RepID=A0ACB9CPD8_ARCLA|nr:hypothetical protein L6452_15653 [Arctium lappa]
MDTFLAWGLLPVTGCDLGASRVCVCGQEQNRMVNTRGGPSGGGDLRDVSSHELNHVVRVSAVVPPACHRYLLGK